MVWLWPVKSESSCFAMASNETEIREKIFSRPYMMTTLPIRGVLYWILYVAIRIGTSYLTQIFNSPRWSCLVWESNSICPFRIESRVRELKEHHSMWRRNWIKNLFLAQRFFFSKIIISVTAFVLSPHRIIHERLALNRQFDIGKMYEQNRSQISNIVLLVIVL